MKNYIIIIFVLSALFSKSQSFDNIWATEKVLKTPESVYYDELKNQIYVSNINGKPTDKDGNGFISLLDTTGKIVQLKWITGFDAPKGMAVSSDTLIVTDIDRIHIISIQGAKIIQTIDVEGASFLNDIVLMPDGVAYITDMTVGNILRLKGNQVESWLSNELLIKPNGLVNYKSHLAVGVKNSILKVDIATKEIKVLSNETGAVDGLIYLGQNKFVISDWSGRITLVKGLEKIVLSNSSNQNIQAADLGYIPDKKWVLIPTFFDNRVVAAQLP